MVRAWSLPLSDHALATETSRLSPGLVSSPPARPDRSPVTVSVLLGCGPLSLRRCSGPRTMILVTSSDRCQNQPYGAAIVLTTFNLFGDISWHVGMYQIPVIGGDPPFSQLFFSLIDLVVALLFPQRLSQPHRPSEKKPFVSDMLSEWRLACDLRRLV